MMIFLGSRPQSYAAPATAQSKCEAEKVRQRSIRMFYRAKQPVGDDEI